MRKVLLTALAFGAMFERDQYCCSPGFIRPMDDLLHDQRKGKFLTPDEKKRIQKYAEEQRKKNLSRRK